MGEARQISQLARDGPAQVIAGEIQPSEAAQAPQGGRNRGELIPIEVHISQARQSPQGGRNRPAQLIVAEVEGVEVGEVDGAGCIVGVAQPPQLLWNIPGQGVVVEA